MIDIRLEIVPQTPATSPKTIMSKLMSTFVNLLSPLESSQKAAVWIIAGRISESVVPVMEPIKSMRRLSFGTLTASMKVSVTSAVRQRYSYLTRLLVDHFLCSICTL